VDIPPLKLRGAEGELAKKGEVKERLKTTFSHPHPNSPPSYETSAEF